MLCYNVILIPKIETAKGVRNIVPIVKSAETNTIMLDKEDIYTNGNGNQQEFEFLVNQCKQECKKLGVKCLELKGVIFG